MQDHTESVPCQGNPGGLSRSSAHPGRRQPASLQAAESQPARAPLRAAHKTYHLSPVGVTAQGTSLRRQLPWCRGGAGTDLLPASCHGGRRCCWFDEGSGTILPWACTFRMQNLDGAGLGWAGRCSGEDGVAECKAWRDYAPCCNERNGIGALLTNTCNVGDNVFSVLRVLPIH